MFVHLLRDLGEKGQADTPWITLFTIWSLLTLAMLFTSSDLSIKHLNEQNKKKCACD